jgi:hypothetical protein
MRQFRNLFDYWRAVVNRLTPNDLYMSRTTPLTSNVAFYIFIQQIQVLNILNMLYSLRFFSSKCSLFHNANLFGSCIIHILYTGCAKIKKKYSGAKGLITVACVLQADISDH